MFHCPGAGPRLDKHTPCVSTQQLGGFGGIPPENFFEFRGYEIVSETIFGPKQGVSVYKLGSFLSGCLIRPYLTFFLSRGAKLLAEVRNMAALHPFTLGGSGGMLPREFWEFLGVLRHILMHSVTYGEVQSFLRRRQDQRL